MTLQSDSPDDVGRFMETFVEPSFGIGVNLIPIPVLS